MNTLAITTAILSHPWQVLLIAVVLVHAARAVASGVAEGRRNRRTIATILTPRQAAWNGRLRRRKCGNA